MLGWRSGLALWTARERVAVGCRRGRRARRCDSAEGSHFRGGGKGGQEADALVGRRRGLTLWTACASLCAAAVDGERAGATALRAAAAGCQRVGGTALWAAARSAAAADFERVGTVGRTTFWASRSRSAGRRSSHPLHALCRGGGGKGADEETGTLRRRRREGCRERRRRDGCR